MEQTATNRIENELKNFFESLGHKKARVSLVLSKIGIPFLITDGYSKFDAQAIFKLHLYKKIKGARSYSRLLENLSDEDAFNLGFRKGENDQLSLPPKRTFNNYLAKLTIEQRKFLDSIAEKVLNIATSNGVVLSDIEIAEKSVKKHKDNQRQACKEAIKLIKKLIYPQVKIKMHHNAKFTTKDLLDALVHVAQQGDFTHNGTATFAESNPDKNIPSSWTILHHLGKFKGTGEILHLFERIFDIIFNFARENYSLLKHREVDVAFDEHKIPYYGNKADLFVSEGKYERGTTHFFKFLTCCIVVNGMRFTISAIPISLLDNIEDLLERMIRRVKSKVKVRYAYLDRGFDKPKIINILKRNNLKFVMPKIRSQTVKAWFDKAEGCPSKVVTDFRIGKGEDKAIVDLVLVDDEDGIKRAFITNFKIPEQLAHYLFDLYSRRWGIESGYRQLANDFRPMTTSKNFIIRMFYFFFSVCLYNLWILVNLCIALSLHGRLADKPIITAKLFALILCRIAYENPP